MHSWSLGKKSAWSVAHSVLQESWLLRGDSGCPLIIQWLVVWFVYDFSFWFCVCLLQDPTLNSVKAKNWSGSDHKIRVHMNMKLSVKSGMLWSTLYGSGSTLGVSVIRDWGNCSYVRLRLQSFLVADLSCLHGNKIVQNILNVVGSRSEIYLLSKATICDNQILIPHSITCWTSRIHQNGRLISSDILVNQGRGKRRTGRRLTRIRCEFGL